MFFPAFSHTTFYHALIKCCNVARAGYTLMYNDRDAFYFSQGHVTKDQPMAVPIWLSESLGI